MRRKDREITDKATMEAVLHKAQVCRLGLSDNNVPYIVPMNYGYRDDCLYLHCAKAGRKMDILKINNSVCFEVDADHALVTGESACDWSFHFSSVIGFGKAFIVDSPEEKKRALDIIMEHYSGKSEHEYSDKSIANVAVIRIEIENMTGKAFTK